MDDFSVLVVDDEEDFVDTLLKRLEGKGVDCEGVYSGAGAIDRDRGAATFDVVLLDMKLADEDGNDVLREMKQTEPGHAGRHPVGLRFRQCRT